MYANLESPRFFEQTAKKELAGVLWRDALAGRSAFTEEASLGLEGLWRRALAGCSAFKDVLAGRSAFCGNPHYGADGPDKPYGPYKPYGLGSFVPEEALP